MKHEGRDMLKDNIKYFLNLKLRKWVLIAHLTLITQFGLKLLRSQVDLTVANDFILNLRLL